ncbi:kinase-like domain-containing protein [Trichoderma aethiopicum]
MSHDSMASMQADGFLDLVLLGSGTQGEVYSSFDEKLKQMVAVKKINASTPSQQEGLKNEIIALRERTHPHITPLLYALLRPQMTLIVTPLARGSIHTIMPMRYDLVNRSTAFHTMTLHMLSALAFLEREGISHGNVKPANVLVEAVTRNGCFVFQLADFAYAEGTYEVPPHCGHAAAVYKAPETFDGSFPLGPEGDVWSLFVTLGVACGRLSERELVRKGLGEAFRDVVEAGVRMPELESMARMDPRLRASAREVMDCLWPKGMDDTEGDCLGEDGEAGCAEFQDYDACGYLDGSFDLSSTPSPQASPARGLPMSEDYTHLPPISSILDASPTTPMDAMSPPPPYSPPYPAHPPQAQVQSPQAQPQPQLQAADTNLVGQVCLESCCITPRSLPSWPSTSITASILTSISVTASLAPYKPLSPIAPSFFPISSARQTPATRQVCITETWSIWGVGRNTFHDASRANHQHHHHHHHRQQNHANSGTYGVDDDRNLQPFDVNRRWEYVPPYPIACDSPPELEGEEDEQSVSEGGSLWSDSGLGYVP